VVDNVVSLDTGFASTPEALIFLYLKAANLKPKSITFAINTHADADHHSDNRAMNETSVPGFRSAHNRRDGGGLAATGRAARLQRVAAGYRAAFLGCAAKQ
jgi:glyoxylase-like metal-dependent hydrolase (beta-lactamase superfamily II)